MSCASTQPVVYYRDSEMQEMQRERREDVCFVTDGTRAQEKTNTEGEVILGRLGLGLGLALHEVLELVTQSKDLEFAGTHVSERRSRSAAGQRRVISDWQGVLPRIYGSPTGQRRRVCNQGLRFRQVVGCRTFL